MTRNYFQQNSAAQSGAIYTADSLITKHNVIFLSSNTFLNNTSSANGGLFSFTSSIHSFIASQNYYSSNYAANYGGVGYILQSQVTINEKGANYISKYYFPSILINLDNHAGVGGGCWYVRTRWSQTQPSSITFQNSTFQSSYTSGSTY